MEKHYALLFNRKTGKVIKAFEGTRAQCRLLGMSGRIGLTKTRDYVVFDEHGTCIMYLEGKTNDFPTICHDCEGLTYESFNIDMDEIIALFN